MMAMPIFSVTSVTPPEKPSLNLEKPALSANMGLITTL
jgi:hypothetical protein